MSLFLLFISGISLTFGPFEPLAYGLYNVFSVVGTNPSFSPITVDMSMMTSSDGENNFNKTLHLVARSADGSHKIFEPQSLSLYSLKIPIILFLEQVGDGIDLREARYAICYQIKKSLKSPPASFFVIQGDRLSDPKLFAKEFPCAFASLE